MTKCDRMNYANGKSIQVLAALAVSSALLTGCTTSNDGLDTSASAVSQSQPFDGNYITGEKFRTKIVCNTLVGRIPNYPDVGPIRFKTFHKADGTLSDHLTFERTGKTDRDIGVWRIEDEEQGIICTRYKKRLGSNEYCHRIMLSDDGRFQRYNVTTGKIGTSGTVLSGNQVD